MEPAAVGLAISLAVVAAGRPPGSKDSISRTILAGGAANAFTSALLNPMDVAKTRMQTWGTRGLMGSLLLLSQQRGLWGAYEPGLTATMLRDLINCSARTGLYLPLRNFVQGSNTDVGLGFKVACASLTGTLGATASNPCDVVKIRMMTGELTRIIPAYKLMLHERSYGRGLPANVSRGIMIAVGELCSYDHSKHLFQRYAVFEEGVPLHVAGSLMAGLCATTLAAPFDIIKTRCMGTNMSLREVLRSIDSPKVLFRGWLPAYLRLAPHALIQFPLLEQMLRWMGLPCF
eukprot:GEMP01059353.1.p1 GENE.GEMP01059353.1~~GEMP01059353.1.p1  ORF type:complete len:289 (+),score=44.25 GEMP01059353.1:282-1148(+)